MMLRRDFVKSAAMLGVTGVVSAAPSTGMFVALNTALTGNKVQWPDFVRLAAKVGFGGADLNLSAAMKAGLDDTKALLAETKMRLSFCNLPVTATGTDEVFQRGMATLEDAA